MALSGAAVHSEDEGLWQDSVQLLAFLYMVKTLSPEVEADLVGRYSRGQSLTFISFATDVPVTAVRATLVKHGVALRKSGKKFNGPLWPSKKASHGPVLR